MTGPWRRVLHEAAVAVRYSYRRLVRPSVIEYNGILLPLDSDLYSQVVFSTISQGEYEVEEAEVIKALLNEDDTVLELGGGIGYIASLCCKIVRDESRVYSFEANPDLIAIAHKTFALNGIRPHFISAAVGQHGGNITLNVHEDFWISSTSPFFNQTTGQRIVRCLPLANLIREISPSVLICDIEGGEANLLDGADLSGLRAIIIEIHPCLIGRERAQEVLHTLLNANFFLNTEHSRNNVLRFDR